MVLIPTTKTGEIWSTPNITYACDTGYYHGITTKCAPCPAGRYGNQSGELSAFCSGMEGKRVGEMENRMQNQWISLLPMLIGDCLDGTYPMRPSLDAQCGGTDLTVLHLQWRGKHTPSNAIQYGSVAHAWCWVCILTSFVV